MGAVISLAVIVIITFPLINNCYKFRKILEITGFICNVAMIGLLIAEKFNKYFSRACNYVKFLFFIFFTLPLITLIIHISLIILKQKKYSFRIIQALYAIIIFIDILSSIITFIFWILEDSCSKIGVNENKYSYFFIIFYLYSPVVGIHFYCICKIYYILKVIIKQIKKKEKESKTITSMSSSLNLNLIKFIFKGPKEYNAEISFLVGETVENLLSEFLEKYKSVTQLDKKKIYFLYNKKVININEKSYIQNYFDLSYFSKEIIIEVKEKDQTSIKKFKFVGDLDLKEEISICIYETVETLISEYFEKIKLKLDNKKIALQFEGKIINKNEKQLIEEYFKIALSKPIITILIID